MKSGRLANWLQVIANLGIVFGLVLVLLQMNKNEELQRVDILNQFVSTHTGFEAGFAGELLPATWEKSVNAPQDLTLAEMRILESVTFTPLQRWVYLYRLAEVGVLEEKDWRIEVLMDSTFYYSTPYARAWWQLQGHRYYDEGYIPDEIFRIVEATVNNAQGKGIAADYERIREMLRQEIQATMPDLTGDWEIHSSVGGAIAITVNCHFEKTGSELSGSCTPVIENPEASEMTGSIMDNTATWGYDVVFNGNPGTVAFQADTITANGMLGTINLSGTEAPFSAIRR